MAMLAKSNATNAKNYIVPDGLPEEINELTHKQRLFIVNYAITHNGVEAVKLAGYKGTYESMRVEASRLLTNANVLKALDAYLRPRFKKHGLTVDRVIEHIADVALSPWRDHIEVQMKDGKIVSARMQMSAKVEMLKLAAKMFRLIDADKVILQHTLDQSIHLHEGKTTEEIRRALLEYLRRRR